MSKLGKIAFLISGLSLFILFAARLIIGGWIDYFYVPLAFTITGFFAALFLDLRYYLEFFTMRTTKHGMNMGTLILGAFALVVVINYMSARLNNTWDMTAEKLYSLTEQSQNVLKDLKSDVEFMVFYRGEEDREARQEVSQALDVYLSASNKLRLNFVNAFVNTKLASQYLQAGDKMKVFAVVGDKKVEVDTPYTENQITSALIRVSRSSTQNIYFLSGHGEKDIDDESTDGISELREALKSNGFRATKINLLKGDKLEDLQGVLAIVGPQVALLDVEIEQVRDFMRQGGKLLIAADPGLNHHMALLTKPLGVEFKNNYLINERVQLLNASPAAVLGVDFSTTSDITKSFAQSDQFALLMLASEVRRSEDANEDWSFEDLLATVPSSYAINSLDQPVNQDTVSRQVFNLGVSVVGQQEKAKEFRLVVFGDSDFMSNRVIFQGINRDLALNSLAFLVKDAGLINVTPKIPEGTRMVMTQSGQLAAVAGGVALPLLFIIVSAFIWVRRKAL